MNALTIHTRSAPAGPVLEIVGDLDYDSAQQLRARLTVLDVQPGQVLVLDLGGMTFCDSSGIAALIAARNHALAARAEITLAAVPERTLRVLHIVGLDQIFSLQPASDAQAKR